MTQIKDAILITVNFPAAHVMQNFMHDLNVLALKYYADDPNIKTRLCSKHGIIDLMTDISQHITNRTEQ